MKNVKLEVDAPMSTAKKCTEPIKMLKFWKAKLAEAEKSKDSDLMKIYKMEVKTWKKEKKWCAKQRPDFIKKYYSGAYFKKSLMI